MKNSRTEYVLLWLVPGEFYRSNKCQLVQNNLDAETYNLYEQVRKIYFLEFQLKQMKRIVMSNDPERKEMDTTQIYLSKNSWGQFLQLHTNVDWVFVFSTKKHTISNFTWEIWHSNPIVFVELAGKEFEIWMKFALNLWFLMSLSERIKMGWSLAD